jgi:hypothetical protein
MPIQAVLLPVFLLVFFIFFILGWTIKERMASTRGILSLNGREAKAKQIGSCLQNLFEMPPLFFVLVILAMMTHKDDLIFVIMEWLYLLFRIGHAFIFVTSNAIKPRGMAFLGSATTLALMWLIFAIHILLTPPFETI